MTEQELWDEFMRLCGLQVNTGRYQGKGFLPEDSIRDQVFSLMDKMREAGLKEQKTTGSYFRNWFFKCHHEISGLEVEQTFSICVYSDGYMELRWG